MDRQHYLRENGGHDNRGQRHEETLSGTSDPAVLARVTDPLCIIHLRTDQMGRRVHLSQRVVFCQGCRLGGD